MSPEERQLLTGLFDRIRGAANAPRDQEAEALIQDATRAQPYAPYLLAQTVLVQDQALRAANDRLQDLEGKVKDLESQAASAPRSGGFLGGLGSLFGGGAPPPRPSAPPPPPPRPLEPAPASAATGRLAAASARLCAAGCRAWSVGRSGRWKPGRRLFDRRARHGGGRRGRRAACRFDSRPVFRA